MTPEQMDCELKRAWRYLMGATHHDEELATDALPFVWRQLQQPGSRLTPRIIRRAIWMARRYHFGNQNGGQRGRFNALDVASRLSTYSTSASRVKSPAREAMVREAVQLVERACKTPLQRQMVRTRILGACLIRKPARKGKDDDHCCSSWQCFKLRCRRLYPSLIGIA